MKKSVAAAIAVLTLAAALPAAALDWSNTDPLGQFDQVMKESPAPKLAPVKGVAVVNAIGKRETDWERWGRILEDAQNGVAVDKADLDWARANFDRMSRITIRRAHLRRQIRRKANEEFATWPKDERPSWKEKREAISIAAATAKLMTKKLVTEILDHAKVK